MQRSLIGLIGWTLTGALCLACDGNDDGDGDGDAGDDTNTDDVDSGDGDESSDGGDADEGDDGTGSGDEDGDAYSECDHEEDVGGFIIQLEAAFTGIQGRVADGVVPVNVPEVAAEEGDCELLTPPNLFCDPACGPSETCNKDGVCIPYPLNHDVGTVTVLGMKDSPIEMTPTPPGFNYTNPGTLMHPGFDEGASIELAATGGDYEAFDLAAHGIAAVTGTPEKVTVDRDMPATVTWDPPGEEGLGRVHLELGINLHGGAAGRIECLVEDNGTFEISASLVNQLFEYGVSGFPSIVLTRRSSDSTTIEPGCVELQVTSAVRIEVEIPGVVSCSNDDDCPDGQTCQADLTCG